MHSQRSLEFWNWLSCVTYQPFCANSERPAAETRSIEDVLLLYLGRQSISGSSCAAELVAWLEGQWW